MGKDKIYFENDELWVIGGNGFSVMFNESEQRKLYDRLASKFEGADIDSEASPPPVDLLKAVRRIDLINILKDAGKQ